MFGSTGVDTVRYCITNFVTNADILLLQKKKKKKKKRKGGQWHTGGEGWRGLRDKMPNSSSSSVICQTTTGPQPLPKRFLHLMRSRASSFKREYPLLSPRSSSNCLRLLPRLLVTSIRPFIFPSITSFRRQFNKENYDRSASKFKSIPGSVTFARTFVLSSGGNGIVCKCM
jgi:hypothetical protein